MKIKALKICYKDRFFKLDVFLGNMLEFFFLKNTNNDEIDSKINDYCNYVDNPYVLKSNLPSISKRKIDNPDRSFPRILAWIYIKLCNSSFLFVRILSFLYFPIFNNTEEALCYFRSVFPEQQSNLCMPRTLFAATTSKSFSKNGVIFIGVFLPSRSMHAWIIENKKQPDIADDIWICYQPLAMLYRQ